MAEKRKYRKRSEYWGKFDKNVKPLEAFASTEIDFSPELLGESLYESVGATKTSANRTEYRTNGITKSPTKDRFQNISDGILPYDYSRDYVSVSEVVELCQKAYFNIASFRTTVDFLSEFADADLYLEGGTAKSRAFVEAWMRKIKIENLKEQFFREYYRSANVFIYKIESKITNSAKEMVESYGASSLSSKVPVRYIFLNPVDVGAEGSISFTDFQYVKILTPFEIARLKKPQSEEEKNLLKSLPKEVVDKINSKTFSTKDKIYLKLEPNLLSAVFAKKQDYEPMAIPSLFAVLDDMNKKIELKKIDQAIARSIENVVLLVTMGAEPDKGGVNNKNLMAMQEIFKNKSVGRVLVSDYTTKAEFIIPDLRKVIGKEKYEILDKDIHEGLQNVLIGESKYGDIKMKMKIFTSRLNEARKDFINEFLQPEIKNVCKSMGMRAWPKAKFKKTDIQDDIESQKIVTRMVELGILTPEQGVKSINSGSLPHESELDGAQKSYIKKRKEGHYMPMVNNVNFIEGDEEEGVDATPTNVAPPNAKKPAKAKDKAVNSPSGGRPSGTSNASTFSKRHIIEATKKISEFELKSFASFAEKYGVEKAEQDKDLIARVSESIVVACEQQDWEEALSNVISDFSRIEGLGVHPEILNIGAEHALDDLSSAILYHSSKISV